MDTSLIFIVAAFGLGLAAGVTLMCLMFAARSESEWPAASCDHRSIGKTGFGHL